MSRREGRERALQALYQLDMVASADEGRDLVIAWDADDGDTTTVAFARDLVRGVNDDRERIDRLIRESIEHWDPARLSKVDLNILRLGTFELLARPDIPTAVTLNEAVEIARRFGGAESPGFVNGVLDRIAATLGVRPAREGRGDAGA